MSLSLRAELPCGCIQHARLNARNEVRFGRLERSCGANGQHDTKHPPRAALFHAWLVAYLGEVPDETSAEA